MRGAWLPSIGKLEIADGSIRIVVSNDLGKYYKSLIDKEVRMFTNPPAFNWHISVWNPKLFGAYDEKKANSIREYYTNDNPIHFEYNIDIQEGGYRKNFRNWYMFVRCKESDDMCEYLGIGEIRDPHHLTISNTKNQCKPYIWYK